MSFFNINFKKKNKVGAIGIIGGADGPTATFKVKGKKYKKEEQEKFLAYAAKQITPCERTFEELEEYLIEKYQAVPHTLLPHEIKTLKANVILNYYDDVLDKPEPLGENPTDKEIIAYLQQDTSIFQAREYPAEKLGLEFKAYKLLGIPSKIKKIRRTKYKKQQESINSSQTENDVIVEMEMNTKYLSITNSDQELMNDLLCYQGVSEKDIEEKSTRFIAYAYTLRHMGKL